MTDNFNFLGLPSVVQDLITNEIVHNSIPEDRIQLALTSKYCNELVQRARPKKIIDQFTIGYHLRFTFIANSREYTKTKEQLMEILPHCQIKQLVLGDESPMFNEDYLEILDMLSEATRFVTKLAIILPSDLDVEDEILGFYVDLKHLKSVTVGNPELILPYYPPKVKLNFGYYNPAGNFLEDLAKKSENCPLSFFELQCDLSLQKCQQFLQTAKFAIAAEICIRYYRQSIPVYLTYLGQDMFTLEMFTKNSLPILISQKFVGESRRILKLKRSIFLGSEFTFNVIKASNQDTHGQRFAQNFKNLRHIIRVPLAFFSKFPDKNYFSGVIKEDQRQMLINLKNVDRDEILEVKFADDSVYIGNRITEYHVRPRYSAEMLESAFPTANFTTPWERVEKINNVFGTNIQLIQAENFVKAVREIQII